MLLFQALLNTTKKSYNQHNPTNKLNSKFKEDNQFIEMLQLENWNLLLEDLQPELIMKFIIKYLIFKTFQYQYLLCIEYLFTKMFLLNLKCQN